MLSLPMIGEIVYPKGIFKALMFLLCSARFMNYTEDKKPLLIEMLDPLNVHVVQFIR